jgi:hypothetical protein
VSYIQIELSVKNVVKERRLSDDCGHVRRQGPWTQEGYVVRHDKVRPDHRRVAEREQALLWSVADARAVAYGTSAR